MPRLPRVRVTITTEDGEVLDEVRVIGAEPWSVVKLSQDVTEYLESIPNRIGDAISINSPLYEEDHHA